MTRRVSGGGLLARNAGLNLVGAVVPLAASLFTVPLLVGKLGTERFGVLSITLLAIGYLGLLDLGLSRALTQLLAQRLGNDQANDLGPLAWSALLTTKVLGVVGGVLAVVLAPLFVRDVLQISSDLHHDSIRAFYWLAFALPFVIGSGGFVGVLAADQRFDVINAISVPMAILGSVAPVVATHHTPTLSAATAAVAGVRVLGWLTLLIACLHTYPFLRKIRGISAALVASLFRIGGWMTVSNIISPLMVYLDRFLIGALLSMSAVAYYATPYDVITKLWIIPGAILATLFPALTTAFGNDQPRAISLIDQGLRAILLALFPVVLIVAAFAPEGLRVWLGAEFARNSAAPLRWLAAGVFINCAAQVAFAALQSLGRPDLTAKLHAAELPLYIASLWLLMSARGVEGAAMAWTLRVAIDAAALFALAAKYVGVPRRMLLHVSGSLCISLLAMLAAAHIQDWRGRLAFVAATLVAFVVIAWNHILTTRERGMVGPLYARLFRGSPA